MTSAVESLANPIIAGHKALSPFPRRSQTIIHPRIQAKILLLVAAGEHRAAASMVRVAVAQSRRGSFQSNGAGLDNVTVATSARG
jgi:hypothetical protein